MIPKGGEVQTRGRGDRSVWATWRILRVRKADAIVETLSLHHCVCSSLDRGQSSRAGDCGFARTAAWLAGNLDGLGEKHAAARVFITTYSPYVLCMAWKTSSGCSPCWHGVMRRDVLTKSRAQCVCPFIVACRHYLQEHAYFVGVGLETR